MVRRLIINADDLGFSEGINRGIFQAHREGILTSATLAVNMPFAQSAAQESESCPELGVGIHLNVVRGRSLLDSQKIPWLTDEKGNFSRRFWSFLPLQLSMDEAVLAQVESEYRAQIEQALEWGISPTHLDSERHHGSWPALFRIMVKLAREFNIGAVRVTREPYWSGAPRRRVLKTIASVALRTITAPANRILKGTGLVAPRYFYGGAHIGEVSSNYITRLASALGDGTHELMIHPGKTDPTASIETRSYLDENREGELAALLDPASRQALNTAGIELINFSAL